MLHLPPYVQHSDFVRLAPSFLELWVKLIFFLNKDYFWILWCPPAAENFQITPKIFSLTKHVFINYIHNMKLPQWLQRPTSLIFCCLISHTEHVSLLHHIITVPHSLLIFSNVYGYDSVTTSLPQTEPKTEPHRNPTKMARRHLMAFLHCKIISGPVGPSPGLPRLCTALIVFPFGQNFYSKTPEAQVLSFLMTSESMELMLFLLVPSHIKNKWERAKESCALFEETQQKHMRMWDATVQDNLRQ